MRGIVAAGHPLTAEAAAATLRAGGNAFDAAVAALWTANVAEPVLCSLGGGGFAVCRPADGAPRVYDFFAHTPRSTPPARERVDFRPIDVDFGTARQQFHIGMASIATPGVVAGLFAMHRDLARVPMPELAAPALDAAREGVTVNAFQGYVHRLVAPILTATQGAREVFCPPDHPDRPAGDGETMRYPALADVIDCLAREGERLFYQGEIGQALARDCAAGGGLLTRADLDGYAVITRAPLRYAYRHFSVLSNPPPAVGGTLVAAGLKALEALPQEAMAHDPARHLLAVAEALGAVEHLRAALAAGELTLEQALAPAWVARLIARIDPALLVARGTTQVSVADSLGNLCSVTVSNGEGSGYVIPGTGIMPNNMLGEADLNPRGFFTWIPDRRLGSMMTPTLLLAPDGRAVVTGSAGSNRIRSAVLQVLSLVADRDLPLADAVCHPRLHLEDGRLEIEGGLPAAVVEALTASHRHHRVWPQRNLFFGGAHSVSADPRAGTFDGAGDPRRGGACRRA